MKFEIFSALAVALVASSEAFATVPPSSSSSSSSSTRLQAEIGETGVAFENVAREWRCKVRFDEHYCLWLCETISHPILTTNSTHSTSIAFLFFQFFSQYFKQSHDTTQSSPAPFLFSTPPAPLEDLATRRASKPARHCLMNTFPS